MAGLLQCQDLVLFQRALKQLRAIDDKIVYALNVSTPTASMQARGADPRARCLQLREGLDQNYLARGEHIRRCISVLEEQVADRTRDRGEVRQDQLKLRSFKNQLDIEEIVKHRTEELFKTKCFEHL